MRMSILKLRHKVIAHNWNCLEFLCENMKIICTNKKVLGVNNAPFANCCQELLVNLLKEVFGPISKAIRAETCGPKAMSLK